MDNNEELLKTAINLHYLTRPLIVSDALKLIESYCNKSQTETEYDEVLKNLHRLMGDLPSNILLYYLTTVPLPKQKGVTSSTFTELMKKSRASLLNNMHSTLTSYINNLKNFTENINLEECIPERANYIPVAVNLTLLEENNDYKINKHEKKQSTNCDECKKLLNVCAEYIIQNLSKLKNYYAFKNDQAWSVLKNNSLDQVNANKQHKLIEDINKKRNWLRSIESGYVSTEILKEIYGHSEIFLKERCLYNIFDDVAFTISDEVKHNIRKFMYE